MQSLKSHRAAMRKMQAEEFYMKRTHQGQSPTLVMVPGDPQTTPGSKHSLRNVGPHKRAGGSNGESGLVVTQRSWPAA